MRLIITGLALLFVCGCNSPDSKESTNATKDSTTAQDTSSTSTSTPAVAGANTLTTAETNDGWKLLFDGKTKGNWHIYNNTSDGSAWKVADGTLYFDPSNKKTDSPTPGGGDLVSGEEFDNFHLTLEWKIDTAGNSGIMFYVKEDPKYKYTYYTGPEMQVLDNQRHPDAKIIKHRAGDLYDLITSTPETVKPALEWNQVDIISNKESLELHLNGTKVVTTTLWNDNWKKLIAGSKFKAMPGFGKFKIGRIALQDHGCKVWFRNIKIKKL